MHGFMMIAALVVAVPDRQDPNVKDVRPFEEQLLGEWRLIKRVHSGREDTTLAVMRMVFAKEMMQQYSGDTNLNATPYPFTLDTARNPIAISFKTGHKGIIKIEGDLLTICLDENAGNAHPSAFASLPNTQLSILQLTRTKR
jgi:uncharacterized protein (TIGR03067 family)